MILSRRLIVAAIAILPASSALAQEIASQPPTPTAATILIYEAGPSWKAGQPVSAQDLAPHLGYVSKAFAEGRVIAYGTEDSQTVVRGYYVLRGAGVADAFAADDPGLRSPLYGRAGNHGLPARVASSALHRASLTRSSVPSPPAIAGLT